MRRAAIFALALQSALLAALPGAAQEAAPDAVPEPTLALPTFDVVSVFQAPPWTTPSALVADSVLNRQQGKGPIGQDVFIWELVPKGQSFSDWTELYAIFAERPLDRPLSQQRDEMASRYGESCQAVQADAVVESAERLVFVLFCNAYVADPSRGEIAIFSYTKLGETTVRNYYHKRGPAFALDDADAWPLSRAEFEEALQLIAAFRIGPREN